MNPKFGIPLLVLFSLFIITSTSYYFDKVLKNYFNYASSMSCGRFPIKGWSKHHTAPPCHHSCRYHHTAPLHGLFGQYLGTGTPWIQSLGHPCLCCSCSLSSLHLLCQNSFKELLQFFIFNAVWHVSNKKLMSIQEFEPCRLFQLRCSQSGLLVTILGWCGSLRLLLAWLLAGADLLSTVLSLSSSSTEWSGSMLDL